MAEDDFVMTWSLDWNLKWFGTKRFQAITITDEDRRDYSNIYSSVEQTIVSIIILINKTLLYMEHVSWQMGAVSI